MSYPKGSLGYIVKKAAYGAVTPLYQVGKTVRFLALRNGLRHPSSPKELAALEASEAEVFQYLLPTTTLAGAISGFLYEGVAFKEGREGPLSDILLDTLAKVPYANDYTSIIDDAFTSVPVTRVAFTTAALAVTGLCLTPNVYGAYLGVRYGVSATVRKLGNIQVYTPR